MSLAREVYNAWLHLGDSQAIQLHYTDEDIQKEIIIYSQDYVGLFNNERWKKCSPRMGKWMVDGDFLNIQQIHTQLTLHEENIVSFDVISRSQGEHIDYANLMGIVTREEAQMKIKKREQLLCKIAMASTECVFHIPRGSGEKTSVDDEIIELVNSICGDIAIREVDVIEEPFERVVTIRM